MARLTSERGSGQNASKISWPEGKTFAFTIFDDPDFQTVERAGVVYDLLADRGFRTTKGVWPGDESDPGGTCADPEYRRWAVSLQERGFEMGWHGARPRTSVRKQTVAGFEKFYETFGCWPTTVSQHYDCRENVYWGDQRVTAAPHRFLYNALTRWRNHGLFRGHIPGDALYWGDICRERVKYVRNFVFPNINTLAACPLMPYHDPARPDVKAWFASSTGDHAASFVQTLSEQNQERLEAEGGACIMYAHFAYEFAERGVLNPRFRELMERLSKKNGWFVPVGTLLDYINRVRGPVTLERAQRNYLERRWLVYKIRSGTA
jgi:hypothetical protein